MFSQPAVQQLFVLPGGFAQILQADHAAAALERVEAATNHGQRFVVIRVGACAFDRFAQRDEHFVGFFKKDFEQLGFDCLGQVRQQAVGTGRDRFLGAAEVWHIRDRGVVLRQVGIEVRVRGGLKRNFGDKPGFREFGCGEFRCGEFRRGKFRHAGLAGLRLAFFKPGFTDFDGG